MHAAISAVAAGPPSRSVAAPPGTVDISAVKLRTTAPPAAFGELR
jgi:hypothetical protein